MRIRVRLTPQDLGLVASAGRSTLDTRRRLKVALITTGNELIEPGNELLHRTNLQLKLLRFGSSIKTDGM